MWCASLSSPDRSLSIGTLNIFEKACKFLRDVITNDYKLGGLQKQKIIPSQFWRSKSETKVLAGPCSSEDSGRESSPCRSQLLVADHAWCSSAYHCLSSSTAIFFFFLDFSDPCCSGLATGFSLVRPSGPSLLRAPRASLIVEHWP